tara:strand:- start:8213 stop:8449 length:237 start_codon:yes stop_codon:yes gene_type:complete
MRMFIRKWQAWGLMFRQLWRVTPDDARGQLLLELLFDPAKIQQRMDAEYNHQIRMRALFSKRASSSEMMFRAMLKRRK